MHFLAKVNGLQGQHIGFHLAKVLPPLAMYGKIHTLHHAGGVKLLHGSRDIVTKSTWFSSNIENQRTN